MSSKKKVPAKIPPRKPTKADRLKRKKGTEGKGTHVSDWLRRLAGIHYITNQNLLSLQEMSLDPEWEVSHMTLSRWSAEDKWVERRKAYFDGVTAQIERQVGKKLVEERVTALTNTVQVFEEGIEKLLSGDVKPSNYEGLVSAMVKLAEHNEKMREKIATLVVPRNMGGVVKDESQVTPTLSVSEARAAAVAVMRERREAIRSAPLKKVQPKLKIVNGDKNG